MDDDKIYKEVYYHKYCDSCKFKDVKDIDEPCNECLDNPINVQSHKPIKWEENDKIKKGKNK